MGKFLNVYIICSSVCVPYESSGLITARRVLYAWLTKLIVYVYDQFVTVSPLWNTFPS